MQVRACLEKRTELLSRIQCPAIWRATDQIRRKYPKRQRSKWFPICCIAIGILLLVPGFHEPKNMLLLLVGGFCIFYGGMNLLPHKEHDPFRKAAERVVEGMEKILPDTCEVVFDAEGMHLRYLPEQAEDCIPYRNIEQGFVTEDLYLLVYGDQIVVLQKKDLIARNYSQLEHFLRKEISWTELKSDA